jgi:hypothetical protein
MSDLVVANRAADWGRLKCLVLDSVSSPITKRVYNLGLDEFIEWCGQEPRPGFTKAVLSPGCKPGDASVGHKRGYLCGVLGGIGAAFGVFPRVAAQRLIPLSVS